MIRRQPDVIDHLHLALVDGTTRDAAAGWKCGALGYINAWVSGCTKDEGLPTFLQEGHRAGRGLVKRLQAAHRDIKHLVHIQG